MALKLAPLLINKGLMNSVANKVKTANYVLASTLMHTSAMVAIAMAPTYFPDMSGTKEPGGEVIEFTVASNDVVYPEPVRTEPVAVEPVVQEVVAATPPPPPKDQLPDKVEEEVTPAVIAQDTPVVEESPVEIEKPSELEEDKLKRQEELAEAERLRKEREKEAVMAAAAAEAVRIAQEQEREEAKAMAEVEAKRLAEEKKQQELAAAEAAQKKAKEEAERKAAEEKAKVLAAAEAAKKAAEAKAAAEQAGKAKGTKGTGNSTEKIVVEQDYLQLKQMAGNSPPAYSQDMRLKKLQGRGQIVYDVTKDGRVANLRLTRSTGHPELDNAAINAFQNYRFVPGQAGSTVHNFEFNLKGPAKAANGRLRSSK